VKLTTDRVTCKPPVSTVDAPILGITEHALASVAFPPAEPTTPRVSSPRSVVVSVGVTEHVPMDAMRLSGLLGCKGVAPEHVLSMRYSLYVAQLHAGTVAAAMVKFQSCLHRAIRGFPEQFIRQEPATTDGKNAVAIPIAAAHPGPATETISADLEPESFGESTLRMHRKLTPFDAVQAGGPSRRACLDYNT
jgi:hypothetical protein